MGFNVSGNDFYSMIEFTRAEANLWNGGSFDFEGSWLSILFQLLGHYRNIYLLQTVLS